ncbi:MAG TPA: site-specific DNA-methyltransferase [Bacillota bacterium]|nr:site-specific DNA-methyltransferase [Bacillota bacterium]HOH09628.1 site-specific DNA-methyltransferase [Bacillota bacterium]HPI00515.1 site-specific DNA-methyltransferase [Bacillota bacterium]HPM62937.1 site-specific DNA-methyltransferase [Bacillota bacterium]
MRKIIPRANQHPTMKPVALAEFFIKLHTKPGDLILDPFMGSGTTGVAVKNLGRNFIGVELDKQWYGMATDRTTIE